jgi:hypothetical protein
MAMAGIEAKRSSKPGRHAFTVQGACTECLGLGWFPANNLCEIQRCDNCKVFESDDAAHAHALELAADALTRPRRRSGKRYFCVIEAVRIAAWEKAGRPDGSFESCDLD